MPSPDRNRLVALWVGACTSGVMLTTTNPTDLWFASELIAKCLGVAAVIGCLAVAIRPSSRILPLAGLPVMFWLLRAADFASDAFHGERTWAGAFMHLCLAGTLYAYWSQAVRGEAMVAALERSFSAGSDGG